jgi:type IV pilus assembly protein PilA
MRERLDKEEGFTLIELMVVVLIIAVLVAIAIPSFLGFRNRAQDRSAQADLRNTLLGEKAVWTDTGAFSTVEADLKEFEPTLIVNTSGAADPGVFVSLSVAATDDAVCLVQASQSGNFFAIFEDSSATGGTFYGASASAIACPTAVGQPADTATVTWSNTGFPAVP